MTRTSFLFLGFFLSLLFSAVYAYLYVFYGLGHSFTIMIRSLMTMGSVISFLGFGALVFNRKKLALFSYLVSLLFIIILWVLPLLPDSKKIQQAEAEGSRNQSENEALLNSAQSVLPCDNGDTAILSLFNNAGTDRYSLSVRVIPQNRKESNRILISTDGRFKAPSREPLIEYEKRMGVTCKNEHFQKLSDTFDALQAHFEKEKIKY